MATEQPTVSNDGASSADPIDRIEAYLAAQDGGDSNDGQSDADDEPKSAAKPTDKPDDDAREKDAEPQFTTTHLAQHLGLDESLIDVDEEGQPVFKTKIDGKESPVKFADLLKSYQLQGHAENRVREVAEKEKAAERKLQEADQAIQAKFEEQQEAHKQVAYMALAMRQELQAERQSYNWDAIWESPKDARALERRLDEREQRINGVLAQLQQRDAQARQQAEAARKSNEEKAKASEVKRLFELIPDWKDTAVAEKERVELLRWVSDSGFDASDLDLNKASQVALLRRAWQHDTLQKSKPEIENKLRAAPKLVKPGQPATKAEHQAADLKSLKQNIHKSGGKDSKAIAEYLMAAGLA